MAVGVVRNAAEGAGITVSIARDPALVRTVRLITAAFARRAGQDEDFVEEIRLAVGEACALMVGEQPAAARGRSLHPVRVSLAIADRLRVHVVASGPVGVEDRAARPGDIEPWALLRGLVDDFSVDQGGPTTTLAMSWPLR